MGVGTQVIELRAASNAIADWQNCERWGARRILVTSWLDYLRATYAAMVEAKRTNMS
jgi:hypothetical protein